MSLHTCAGSCTDGAARSCYLSRSCAGTNILGSDQEKGDETVLKKVPTLLCCRTPHAWKQLEVGPTETSRQQEEETLEQRDPCVNICARMNPMWKLYKSKVLKTLNSEHEEDPAEEVHNQSINIYIYIISKILCKGTNLDLLHRHLKQIPPELLTAFAVVLAMLCVIKTFAQACSCSHMCQITGLLRLCQTASQFFVHHTVKTKFIVSGTCSSSCEILNRHNISVH